MTPDSIIEKFREKFPSFMAYRTEGTVGGFSEAANIRVTKQLEHCEDDIESFLRESLMEYGKAAYARAIEDAKKIVEEKFGCYPSTPPIARSEKCDGILAALKSLKEKP